MVDASGIPRAFSPNQLGQKVADLERKVEQASSARKLEAASIGKGGLTVKDNGALSFLDTQGTLTIEIEDGALVVYDETGNPMARFGELLSSPGEYGGEIWVSDTWVPLLAAIGNTVSWGNIPDKPAVFPPDPSASVAHATTADTAWESVEATHSEDTDGSQYGFNNTVGGTSWVAAWIGSDGKFGRNTSSIRYKENVRPHMPPASEVLKLEPVLYDRKRNGPKNEFGLIAEQVLEHVPELAVFFDGGLDGVRYDLLSVALLSVVKDQEARIARLEAAILGG